MYIEDQFKKIKIKKINKKHRYPDIDIKLLIMLINYLKSFKHASNKLEGNS